MKDSFVCCYQNCKKLYANKSILKRHIQSFHHSSKKFQCSFCGKALASSQNLKEHLYIHTGQKPYKCSEPGCQVSFRQGTHLSAHKRLEHGNSEGSNARGFILINDVQIDKLTGLLHRVFDDRMLQFLVEKKEKIRLMPIKQPTLCKLPSIFEEF